LVGIGLKVEDRYDNADNTWLGMNNSTGEWCVAYHGVGKSQKSDKVKYMIGEIIKNEFKACDKNIKIVLTNFIQEKSLVKEFIVHLRLK